MTELSMVDCMYISLVLEGIYFAGMALKQKFFSAPEEDENVSSQVENLPRRRQHHSGRHYGYRSYI